MNQVMGKDFHFYVILMRSQFFLSHIRMSGVKISLLA